MRIRLDELARQYRQAPWRSQRQWLSLILLGVVLVAMVASIYLNVTARGTLAGREVLILTDRIGDTQRTIADLKTQLAITSSEASMRRHAQSLGFVNADAGDIVYVVVPGYEPQQGIDLSTTREKPAASIILPEYRQTLFEWFADQIQDAAATSGDLP